MYKIQKVNKITNNETFALNGKDIIKISEVQSSIFFSSNGLKIVDAQSLDHALDKIDGIQIESKDQLENIKSQWDKQYKNIFKYYFSYPIDREELIFSFISSVRGDWSSEVRRGDIPKEWKVFKLSNNVSSIEFTSTLLMAIQYGRNERIIENINKLDKIQFCKKVINTNGIKLTNPITGERKIFKENDLHLTSIKNLYNKIGTNISGDYIRGY